jgi:hypothetical protein
MAGLVLAIHERRDRLAASVDARHGSKRPGMTVKSGWFI